MSPVIMWRSAKNLDGVGGMHRRTFFCTRRLYGMRGATSSSSDQKNYIFKNIPCNHVPLSDSNDRNICNRNQHRSFHETSSNKLIAKNEFKNKNNNLHQINSNCTRCYSTQSHDYDYNDSSSSDSSSNDEYNYNSSTNGSSQKEKESTKILLRLFLFQIHPDYFLQVSSISVFYIDICYIFALISALYSYFSYYHHYYHYYCFYYIFLFFCRSFLSACHHFISFHSFVFGF